MQLKENRPYTRTRHENTQYATLQTGVTEWLSPPAPDTELSWSGEPGGRVGGMTDSVIPNFRKLIANGVIVNNPMSKAFVEFDFPFGVFVDTEFLNGVNNTITTYSGEHGGVTESIGHVNFRLTQDFGLPSGRSEEALIHEALVKARNRISPVHFMSIVSVVELPKTLRLIRNAAKSLYLLNRGVTKGSWSDIKRSFAGRKTKLREYKRFSRDTAVKRWLEFRYGWTPLMLELQGLLDAIQNPAEQPKLRQTARGFSGQEFHHEETISVDHGSKYGVETRRFQVEKSTKVRAYSIYRVESSGFQSIRDYGLIDIPQAMWEIMPYSFIVDWFVPVGKWLEAITPKLGIITLAEGYTIERKYNVKRIYSSHSPGSGSNYIVRSGFEGHTDQYTTYSKNRHINSNDVLANFPPIDVKLDVSRVLDSIALITGASTRKSTIRI